jgi:large subunit ribosomal protein L35
MPKQKTHKGASKLFSLTATGKLKRKKAFHSHILTKKTTKRKRNMRKSAILDARDTKGIKRLIPYA